MGNVTVNVPRKRMKAIQLLWTRADKTDSEEFAYHTWTRSTLHRRRAQNCEHIRHGGTRSTKRPGDHSAAKTLLQLPWRTFSKTVSLWWWICERMPRWWTCERLVNIGKKLVNSHDFFARNPQTSHNHRFKFFRSNNSTDLIFSW